MKQNTTYVHFRESLCCVSERFTSSGLAWLPMGHAALLAASPATLLSGVSASSFYSHVLRNPSEFSQGMQPGWISLGIFEEHHDWRRGAHPIARDD